MVEAVVVAAARSPIGRARKGSLREVRADDLTAAVVREVLDRVPQIEPESIDDLYLGCGMPGGEQGFNMARVVAVLLGLDRVPGATVTRYCASSLQATRMAFHAIRAGEADVVVAAGVECVSRFAAGSSDHPPTAARDAVLTDWTNPRLALARERTRARTEASSEWSDPRDAGQLPDVYGAMGATAENVADLCGVTRREMDEYALLSQQRCQAATDAGFWRREVTPYRLPTGEVVTADDSPRRDVSLDALAALEPRFRTGGRVTAGNSCPLNDGAAALVVMSSTAAAARGVRPLARIVSSGVSALSPEIMGLGPIEASRQALRRAGMRMTDVDVVELNEAFAAQVVPVQRALDIPTERLNVMGGAIAVGHPFGMTGARLVGTLLNVLDWHGGTVGLATMCVGGGQGMAMVVERV